jgi:hypothetical protein
MQPLQTPRSLIESYLAPLVFIKVEAKEYLIYAARISDMLTDANVRFILVFVPGLILAQPPARARIYQLPWKSVSTRSIAKANAYKIPPQTWKWSRDLPDLTFKQTGISEKFASYVAQGHPQVELTMLHDPRKKTKHQYHQNLSLSSALSTFSCVISVPANESNMSVQTLPPPLTVAPTYTDDSFEYIE